MSDLAGPQQTTLDEFMMSKLGTEPRVPTQNKIVKSRIGNSTFRGRGSLTGRSPQSSKNVARRDFLLKLQDFVPRCPIKTKGGRICGQPAVIRRGKTASGKQRYGCAAGHRFVLKSILDEVDGEQLNAIIQSFIDTGSVSYATKHVNSQFKTNLGRKKVRKLLTKVNEILSRFEEIPDLKLEVSELEIDEIYQRVSGTRSSRLRNHCWIVNAFDPRTNYWIVSYVAKERNYRSLDFAFKIISNRCRTLEGRIIRTDGLEIYKGLARKHRMHLFSKGKEYDFSFINRIEALHAKVRRRGLRKDRSYSADILNLHVNFIRWEYNLFLRQNALGGLTPFECAFGEMFRDWIHLVHTAEVSCPLPRSSPARKEDEKVTLSIDDFLG